MSGQQAAPGPEASPGEVRATQKVAAAQRALNRTFTGSLLKLAAIGGGVYAAYYMWSRAEEPLPEPVTEAVSKVVSVGGGAMQQQVEEVRGNYPGSASDVPGKDRQEAAKASKAG